MKGLLVFCLLVSACNSNDTTSPDPTNNGATPSSVPSISYAIRGTRSHDTTYFTEGLEFYNNNLIESTGLNGKSRLVKKDPVTGRVLNDVVLDPKYFGEGCTVLRDTVYQLTYQENTVFLYDVKTFGLLRTLTNLKGEGWGLTNDGTHLIASNGSSDLYFYKPGSFELVKTLTVTRNGGMVNNINELEYVDGFVWANEWNTNLVNKIDLKDGRIVGSIDFSREAASEKAMNPNANEMNGIAFNPATKTFWITGKNWSRIYEVAIP